MANTFDVTIISVFGRGHWMASELSEKGYSVALVDVSSQMGRWAPEDWEGPFGFYRTEKLTASQVERLAEDDYHDSIDEGFVVWLPDGPIDMKGPLSSFWFTQRGLDGELSRYISSYDQLADSEIKEFKKSIERSGYQSSWFVQLAHQLACTQYFPNSKAVNYGRPLPLFSSLNVRRASRRGFESSLQWCESKGVRVYRESTIADFQVESNQLVRMEVQSAGSQVLNFDKVIWTLSSAETARLGQTALKTLFLGEELQPCWSWVRFRFEISKTGTMPALPSYFVMIQDVNLPWTHENMCVVQQTVKREDYDVWVRIPTELRFRQAYVSSIGERLSHLFIKKIPGAIPTVIDMPQDYLYEAAELGPSRNPVYDPAAIQRLRRAPLVNVVFDGPECWSNLDWISQLGHQQNLLKQNFFSDDKKSRNTYKEAQL